MKDDPSLTPVTEVISDKSTMALQSAVSLPLEIFPKNNGVDEDNTSDLSFHLGLSDAEEEVEKSETKSPKETDDNDMDNEDAIIDKFDTAKNDSENVTDEAGDAYFDEKILDSPPSGTSENVGKKSNNEKNESESGAVSAEGNSTVADQSDKINGISNGENEEDGDSKMIEINESDKKSDIDESNEKAETDVEYDLPKETAESVDNSASEASQTVGESVAQVAETPEKTVSEDIESVEKFISEVTETSEKILSEAAETVEDSAAEDAETVKKDMSEVAETADKVLSEIVDTVEKTLSEDTGTADKTISKVTETAQETSSEVTKSTENTAPETAETAEKTISEFTNDVQDTNAIPDENVEEDKSAEESNITKQMNESMDTENLLAVTNVKEVSEDMDNDNQENEKDDGSNENSSSSSSEKDDMEEAMDETVNDEIVDKEIDDVEMEEVGEKIVGKDEDTESMDVVDIEENNPLTDDVDTEVNKEYESLTKEDSSQEKQTVSDSETGVTKTQSDISNASDVAEKSQTEVNKDILTSDSVEAVDSVSVTNAPQSTNECGVPSDISSKLGKRTLSEPDLLKTPKKIKLTEDESLAAKKIKILGGLSEFMASKKLEKMSNTDLEEYCLQKICEVLIYKSEVADLRDQLQKQESLLEKWRKEYRDLAKQTRDLEIVHKKLMDELKRRPSNPESIEPVKITRSVGLQVKLYDASSVGSPMKRRFSRGQETPQSNVPVISQINKPATRTAVTPTQQRQPKQNTPKLQTSPLLSQALQKDTTTPQPNATSKPTPTKQAPVQNKGFIDLTEEDDKKTTSAPPAAKTPNRVVTPVNKTQTAIRSTTPVTQSIQLVTAPQLKPNVPGAPSGQRYMYLVNPPNVITTTATDPSKPGAPKTLMLKFPSGILGQTNGILPTLQNGNSTISVLPQVTTIRAGQVRLQAPQMATPPRGQAGKRHPAPLPQPGPPPVVPSKKPVPPKPQLSIRKSGQGIVLSWKMPHNLDLFEVIASYQLYAYQETSKEPKPDMWRKVGDVKALALPMACTLTQFADGNKYYFAVRAVDVYKRIGAFSDPEQIML